MNSQEIQRKIEQVCGDIFVGVYAKNRLPELSRTPALLIANTDDDDKSGTHWVALYIARNGEYFDTFAKRPHQTFINYMNKYCVNWIASPRQVQSSISRFCGHHCVMYCIFKSRGMTLRQIYSIYTLDFGLNDVVAHDIVCRRLL